MVFFLTLWLKYSKTSRSPSSALFLLLREGSPTKIDYRKKVGTLLRTSLLEELDMTQIAR